MKKLTRIFVFIATVGILGCGETDTMKEENLEPKRVVYDSVENLDELIVLPVKPNSVKWSIKKSARTGSDSGLVVLLHFDQENYEKIVEQSEKPDNVRGDAVVNREFYERWVPDEVKEELGMELHQDGEAIILVGRPYLNPNLFVDLNGMSPYVHGKVYPLGMGYIALSLYTM